VGVGIVEKNSGFKEIIFTENIPNYKYIRPRFRVPFIYNTVIGKQYCTTKNVIKYKTKPKQIQNKIRCLNAFNKVTITCPKDMAKLAAFCKIDKRAVCICAIYILSELSSLEADL
jgi:hypothetical protein